MASMQSPFFRLTRELRDTFYHFYVYEPDGYHFDFSSLANFELLGIDPLTWHYHNRVLGSRTLESRALQHTL